MLLEPDTTFMKNEGGKVSPTELPEFAVFGWRRGDFVCEMPLISSRIHTFGLLFFKYI